MSYFKITSSPSSEGPLLSPLPAESIFRYNKRKHVFSERRFPCHTSILKSRRKARSRRSRSAGSSGATNLLHDVLGKNKATTVVTIDEVDTDNWGIGGVPITEIRKQQK